MNLFRDQPGELDQADQDAVRALAEFATIAILQARALSDAMLIAAQSQAALDTAASSSRSRDRRRRQVSPSRPTGRR